MSITKEEVAEADKTLYSAIDSNNLQVLSAMEAQSFGFGFRRQGWRKADTLNKNDLEPFYANMEAFSIKLIELQTSVVGDVGLAWGVQSAEFQEKGRSPEIARVRFSQVLTKVAEGWHVLLYHRDIQPFNEDGTYPRELIEVNE